LSEDALQDGDWVAVHQAVEERLGELRMSASHLARETGLSPTTIRYLGTPTKKHNKSTLVALSGVLGWRYDYLINILLGRPQENARSSNADGTDTAYFENLLRAEVGPVREELAELVNIVSDMGQKIDLLFQGRGPSIAQGESA
jgi:hypothetical protein